MKPSISCGRYKFFLCKKIDTSRRLLQLDNPRIGARKHARRHLILLNLDGLAPGLVAAQSSHRDLMDDSTRSNRRNQNELP
jgi:hypothetical protein